MTKKSTFIGIVPLRFRKIKNLGELNLSELTMDDGLTIPSGKIKVKDLTASDHIVVYPSSKIWFKNYNRLKCKVSLMIFEPKAVHIRYYAMLWLLRFKFQNIFICYKDLADKYSNIITLPLAECWIPELSDSDFLKKEKRVSLIASNKNQWAGHKLRHQIVREFKGDDMDISIDVMGHGYRPFANKEDGLLPYQFSIIIENVQEDDHFTEKLVDCFACKTVPIYWGASNIGDYFNLKGMIIFQTIEDLQIILNKLTSKKYEEFHSVIEENCNIARNISNTKKLITDKLK